jgi:hypothetical protein
MSEKLKNLKKYSEEQGDVTGYDNWVERTPHWDKHKDGLFVFKDFCVGPATDTKVDTWCTNRNGLAKYTIKNCEGKIQGSIYLCARCLKTHQHKGWEYIKETEKKGESNERLGKYPC